jgi:hypothetical protein
VLPERLLFGEADHNNLVDGKPVVDIKATARLGHEKLHLDRLSDQVQLFDLARDPREQQDLAPGSPQRVALLRAALARFQGGAIAGQASGTELSAEDLELLRRLGYVGDEVQENGKEREE